MFNIKVKSINGHVLEGTRATNGSPFLSERAKGKPEEVSKSFGGVLVLDLLVGGLGASQGQENLLSKGLTDGNIFPQLMAVGQQPGLLAADGKGLTTALVAEVGFRESIEALVRENIQETKVDDINGRVLTEISQPVLIGSLALSLVSVILVSRPEYKIHT